MGTNTGLGIGIGIPFKNNALGGDKPYFPPELKARMIGVWTNYGKKNTDADRNIIKNKIPNAGGDLEILNAVYKLNSGFGEYNEDFTTWTKSSKITSVNSESFSFSSNVNWVLLYYKSNIGKDIPSFKVHIKLKGEGKVFYNYITSEGVFTNKVITSEEYVVPISYNTKYTGETPVNCGFSIGITSEECSGTITQIPNFEDAFVTDGINDMIISQKTLQEMGVTKELTIVSMIHQISWRNSASVPLTNQIRPTDNIYARNQIANIGKTGIYGYVVYNIKNSTVGNSHIVNTILGDKNDYSIYTIGDLSQGKFSVQGYIDGNGNIRETSSVAHYWTFAVLGKATEDEINLIIGNYNLDRSLKPDILCNIGKQGITNDNHAEFNNKLIDYSGNGRDIQMNNLAWKGGSGIAAKQYETFKDWTSEFSSTSIITQIDEFTRIVESTTNGYWVSRIRRDSDLNKVYDAINVYLYQDNNFLIHECKYEADGIKYIIPINESVGKGYHKLEIYTKDRYTKLPENAENVILSEWYSPKSAKGSIKYSIIPSCKGGILLDGINDFGKVTGMPIYKDYTIIADYERFYLEPITGGRASILSKSSKVGNGSFIFNLEDQNGGKACYTFGEANGNISDDITRIIRYQSKYYNTKALSIGTAEDNDFMVLGKVREADNRYFYGAIYSLMTFPYSMSEFLIERQLKKHKLGTLYPDMVEFRPVIKSNASYDNIVFYYKNEKVENGTYLTVGSSIGMHIRLSSSPVNEIKSITVNGIPATFKYHDANNNIYQYDFNLTSKSPQNINITIDEYIRFEDIKQPYPVIFQVKDRHTSQIYNYGDKIKVGSSIQLSQSEKPNLLSGLYSIKSYEYEGETYSYNQLTNLNIILTKQSISLSCNKTWLLDDNEPKCILSPRLLRIPNSSYKILGYIPDISGHGNHGKINNSAYAEGSGVNEDGSYQFDGVDDFVTIPTIVGGKQVLMKMNWQSDAAKAILYDQRGYNNEFVIYNGTTDSDGNPIPAYQGRNNGQTYIDGILNSNIMASELKAITHNITITNELSLGTNNTYPVIGSTRSNTHFTQMSLYDFMLFDEISTDDKILELNKYVGIEAKVELPPYYWDAYGKTNLDADKATIQQRGTAVGDYDLTNYNHAYDKMSGYGGYKFAKFDNELDWYLTPDNGYIDVVSRNGYSITLRNLSTSNYGWYFQNSTVKEFITKDIPFKVKANKSIRVYWDMHSCKSNGKNFGYVVNNITLNPNEDTSINLRHLTEEELTELDANKDRMYYLLWFDLSTLAVDEEVTVEMLPLYPNGLAYDGITDYSKNANISVLTDYTYIYKRTIINIPTNAATLLKGADKTNGGAFIADYGNKWQFNFGQYNIIQGIADGINWQTVNSFNGTSINKGENTDDSGITVAKFSNGYTSMVFYKLILYPKTISLLEINFLKNLMEKDEIIDLTNPIFIKNE